MSPKSILFVHAHPDDECIPTGVTIAKYAAEGAHVTVVTCTRGEVGEIVVDDLKHLASDGEDALGEHRVGEMAAAARALGLTDHRWLGGLARYRDSGMMGTPTNDDPRCFWRADLDEAARALADVIEDVRPQVLVTYDDNGGYGHPDHIQVHRVSLRALDLLGPDSGVAKVYYSAFPKSALREGWEYFKATGDEFFAQFESADDLPFGVDDGVITTVVRAPEHLDAKYAAMRAHRSQIEESAVFFALPPELAERGMGWEHYVLLRGERGPVGADGWETDLFAGLDHVE